MGAAEIAKGGAMEGRRMNGKGVREQGRPVRVVVASFASCFGCQLQITNMERDLMDVLGQFDLSYWQLASSDPMPDEFDVVIVEGAITTEEAEASLRDLRERAQALIAVGACATTAGIPGMVAEGFYEHPGRVYEKVPAACGSMITPRPVSAIVDVDFEVRCCPMDPYDFVVMLQRAIYGSNKLATTRMLCSDCKRNETECFFEDGTLCMGLVTSAGCGARCVNLGRPCQGCAGLSPHANLESARVACERYGMDVHDFNEKLQLFNQTNPALQASE